MTNSHSLRILILHNRYRQPGGEDVVAAAQARLLRERGHDVHVFERDNREIDRYGLFRKALLFFTMADNPTSAAEVAKIVREFKPQVAHVHNTLPLLSPSVYAPLKKAGVPVIQYLHNYRLVCAAGTLFRDGAPCTLCVDDSIKHAVKYRCWTGSLMASLGFTRMLEQHRRAATWRKQVDLYVALNSYQRQLLTAKKIVTESQIVVQPNFIYVEDAPPINSATHAGDGFVFAGRLTNEKGVLPLLFAFGKLANVRLSIFGDGPLRAYRDEYDLMAQRELAPNERQQMKENISFVGQRPREELLKSIANARALIFPSLWQEGSPATVIEAMAMGKPVIASRVAGAMELVKDGETGLLFETGNADALAACVQRLQDDPALAAKLGAAARARYLAEHSPDAGYKRMLANFKRVGLPVSEQGS